MKILIDIMSGDKAPVEQLIGAMQAATETPSVSFGFIGNEDIIRAVASARGLDVNLPNIEIVHTSDVITMDDAPLSVVREKKDSSMGTGLKMLAEGKGDAFVSAGNTGALHAGSTLIVRRIRGIQKSAIATVIPFKNPTLLIDSGANIEIAPETYVQLAKMGSVYMSRILKVDNPRVGLLNIGAEKAKGTKTVAEAYGLLEKADGINFIGNVEGKELPMGACDVLVCDGFSGNIVLKLTEGCAAFMVGKLKDVFNENPMTKLSALCVKNGLKKMKKDFDASEYGGAPILGLSKTVIKAHGSSDAAAIKNAVRQAIGCVENNVVYEIAKLVVPEIIPREKETPSGKN